MDVSKLKKGFNFIKFAQAGLFGAQPRILKLSDDEKNLFWVKKATDVPKKIFPICEIVAV